MGGLDGGLGLGLKRGEIWTAASRGDYAAKPRPVVVIQHDHFQTLESVTICGFTTDPTDLPLFRIAIAPTPANRLQSPCRIMVDKILTVPKQRLQSRLGKLDHTDILRLNEALRTFLGLIG